MTTSQDYRLYLEGQFKSLNKSLDSLMGTVEDIKKQTTLTNSRVTHLEEFKVIGEEAIRTRVQPEDFKRVERKLDCMELEFRDVGFFARHPKMFVGLIVVLVVLSLVGGLGNIISKFI